ncbi:MAG: SAM-dependent methyltransferase, partial [Acidimicrobiia bacterium]
LLAPLLDERDGAVSGEVWAVEASPAARAALAQILPPPRVVDTMGALPRSLHGVVIANELLDNLPVALASRRQDGWAELRVTVSGDTLALTPVPPRPHVAAWAVRYGGASPVGGQVEVEQAAAEWVTAMVGRLTAGTLVVVDYGGTSGELAHRRAEGTLRTYRGHHLGPDPLLEPGATDVTVDVDFTAMRDAAEAAGATVTVLRQDDFLTEWGLREAVDALRAREAECARAGDTIGQLRARDERIGAETLLHPRGLGDFRVLLARV